LAELPRIAPLTPDSSVLDAGCGLGHGLRALRRAYPQARLAGTEWSRPLAWAARIRCPWARVARGDLWAQDWSPFALVYLFQRPETMPRAVAKAAAELAPGGWLASLEFAAMELEPQAVARCADGRSVWLYRQPFVRVTPRRRTPRAEQEPQGWQGHGATVRGPAADNPPRPPAAA
jgi:trans-aconitate methyltransferase